LDCLHAVVITAGDDGPGKGPIGRFPLVTGFWIGGSPQMADESAVLPVRGSEHANLAPVRTLTCRSLGRFLWSAGENQDRRRGLPARSTRVARERDVVCRRARRGLPASAIGHDGTSMRILLTGASGSIGAALAPALLRQGHELRGFGRDPDRIVADIPVIRGDAVSGAGLDEALDGIEVAYFLIHSMEGSDRGGFEARERTSAENFVAAAQRAGVRRVVYLGGIVPRRRALSRHLRSRLEVEQILLAAVPEAVALRASIVIGARSRSFRFLVHLVERMKVLALPAWREHRTQPIDVRDVRAFLLAAATTPHALGGLSLDIAGPDLMTYGRMIERIADLMLVQRRALRFGGNVTPIVAPIAARVAGEDPGFVGPLMESLGSDLLPRDERAASLLGVRLHSFDRAVERALREWEASEPLSAR
jgi:uncharacterized protein YbjT (DUF2867 family)